MKYFFKKVLKKFHQFSYYFSTFVQIFVNVEVTHRVSKRFRRHSRLYPWPNTQIVHQVLDRSLQAATSNLIPKRQFLNKMAKNSFSKPNICLSISAVPHGILCVATKFNLFGKKFSKKSLQPDAISDFSLTIFLRIGWNFNGRYKMLRGRRLTLGLTYNFSQFSEFSKHFLESENFSEIFGKL